MKLRYKRLVPKYNAMQKKIVLSYFFANLNKRMERMSAMLMKY